MHRSRSLFLSLGVSLVFAASLQAIVYIVPSDRDLVRRADAIVIATAIESHAELTARGAVVTESQLHVEDVLKGSPLSGSELRLVEPGGIMSERATIIPGSPRYEVGDRYLIFLRRNADGQWTTWGFQLGQFRFTDDPPNRETLERIGGETMFGFEDGTWLPHIEKLRDAEGFCEFVRATARTPLAPAAEEYFVHQSEHVAKLAKQSEKLVPSVNSTRPDYLSTGNYRWQGSSASMGYCCAPNFATLHDGPGAASAAVNNWNGVGTSFHYDTPAVNTGNKGLTAPDGLNTILFDDPNNELACCPGATGIGGISQFSGTYTLPDGFTYSITTEVDVVIGKNSGVSQDLFNLLVTHEVGHTLGFRHADQMADNATPCAAPLPCAAVGAAVMAHFVSSGLTGLQQWDRDAMNTVYGSGPACTNPSITTQPQSQSIASGASATLSVVAGGSSPFTYQWYIGTSPNTSNSIPGATSSTVTVSPTVTTNYWVRVSNSCTPPAPADSNTAIVTVQACQPPNIISPPQDQTVPSGSSAQLTVGFNGTAPITVTWYRGTSGDTSQGSIGTGPTVNTPPITMTSMFWARLQNSCGTADTRTVTVNAGACTPPTINTQPQDQTVSPGGTVVLNVGFSGSGASVSWFQGNSGDMSGGVIATGPTTISPPINANTSFWARVTGCGQSVNSRTAIISVSAGCVPPSIATSPANQTIGRGSTVTLTVVAGGTAPLHYAWFQGASGDESTPVGTDADTFTSASLTAATQFWVKVTNTCGAANSTAASITVAVGRKHAVKRR